MARVYLAHMKKDDLNRKNGAPQAQSLSEHLRHVAGLMSASAEAAGLSSTAYLIGILHDLGKCSEAFAEYLSWSHAHPGDYSRKGTVDHSSAGGQLLMQRYGKQGGMESIVIEIAALTIFSHHSGLLNYLGEHGLTTGTGGKDTYSFLHRMSKADVLEGVDLAYFFREIISEEELDRLFAASVREISAWEEKIGKEKLDVVYHFYWGMVVKLLFSMLVDADRLDSAEFELGDSLTCAWDTESLWAEFSAKLEKKLTGFPIPREEKARQIAQLREKISGDCLHAAERTPGIYRLTVPTGGGKTLAGMRFALTHAKRWHKKRIIVVIPYTSIISIEKSLHTLIIQRFARIIFCICLHFVYKVACLQNLIREGCCFSLHRFRVVRVYVLGDGHICMPKARRNVNRLCSGFNKFRRMCMTKTMRIQAEFLQMILHFASTYINPEIVGTNKRSLYCIQRGRIFFRQVHKFAIFRKFISDLICTAKF